MKVHFDAIPDAGLRVSADLETPWAREAAGLSMGGDLEQLSLTLKVERMADHLRVTGKGEATAVRPCDRCGESVRIRVKGPIDLYYGPKALAAEGSVELASDELDIGWFDGESLELADVVSEQLALWTPGRIRCHDRGVEQVDGPHPCALPASATEGPDLKPRSPFAKLRLPE